MQRQGFGGWRQGGAGLLMALLMALGACGGGSSRANATPTAVATYKPATPSPVASAQPTVVAIPADYSVYIDPTWGYAFEYPALWNVTPQIGNQESNVVIAEPYNPDPNHAMVRLLVRVTSNFQHAFVQQYLCGQATTTTVGSYKAVDLTTSGGDPTHGYSAIVLGRAFFATGLAFEIWLQGSNKSAQTFFTNYGPTFQHVLATFTVGNGGQTTATCG